MLLCKTLDLSHTHTLDTSLNSTLVFWHSSRYYIVPGFQAWSSIAHAQNCYAYACASNFTYACAYLCETVPNTKIHLHTSSKSIMDSPRCCNAKPRLGYSHLCYAWRHIEPQYPTPDPMLEVRYGGFRGGTERIPGHICSEPSAKFR